MNRFLWRILIPVLLVLLLVSQTLYTVIPQQVAVVEQMGHAVAFQTAPGAYFKVPFLQQVRRFDTNRQILGGAAATPLMTSDKQLVQPEWYVSWRIADVPRFYAQLQDVPAAQKRLQQLVQSSLRSAIAAHTLADINAHRAQVAGPVLHAVAASAAPLGVQVADLRLNRLDLAPDTANAIYQRMQADEQRQAEQVRIQGMAAAARLRADADHQRDAILANADNDAARIKGEGEAQAAAIVNKAAAQDPEFYRFYKSLETYKQTFKDKHSILVLGTDSAFFRYFRAPEPSK